MLYGQLFGLSYLFAIYMANLVYNDSTQTIVSISVSIYSEYKNHAKTSKASHIGSFSAAAQLLCLFITVLCS